MRKKLFASRLGRFAIQRMRRGRTPDGWAEGSSILDIGCAAGEYLAYLRGQGWEVQGIEVDPEAAQQARELLGIDVRTGAAEARLPELPTHQFVVVSMWHVLEHVDDPRAVLAEVRRIRFAREIGRKMERESIRRKLHCPCDEGHGIRHTRRGRTETQ